MVSLIEEEYEAFTRERKWKQVFDRIQNEASLMYNLTAKHARLPENRDRNRYRDVSPYDDHRVRLEGCENNYINASNVQVPLAGRRYILTQGPLASTSGHFWLMIWQQNTRGVLMLNKVVEDGRLKCHPYFPLGADVGGEDALTFEDVNIRVEHLHVENRGYFLIRKLKLVNLQTAEEKMILQFHYVDWPDFGIPKNSETFLSFLYAVRQSGVIPSFSSKEPKSSQCGPPVIHCSAGIGRSGTFCLVDSALVLVERTKSLSTLDLRAMLLDMRRYRCGLIQRPEQLQFSYMAILDGAHAILSSPPPSPIPSEPETASESDISADEEEASGNDDELSDEQMDESSDPALNNANKNALEESPAPPLRTTSLKRDEETQPQPTTQVSTATNKETPTPPQRSSSLQKSASMDEHPPPVPPRPLGSLDRQWSAPPSSQPRSADDKNKDVFNEDEEEGYENTSSSVMRKRREEKQRNLKDKVEEMRAKQRASEAAKDWPPYLPRRGVLVGAGVVLLFAVGAIYFRPSLGL